MLLSPINITSLFTCHHSSITYISIDDKILKLGSGDKKIYYSLISKWEEIAIDKIIEYRQIIDLYQREIAIRNKTILTFPLWVSPEPLPNDIGQIITK